ncbi:tocopherol cyclase family protein [Mycobacterium camsae]|uniref:tocopherol cyclase family protein n=1 Tax=Mycobacterium gordonae TaxID=1778 RepID=UPI001F11FFCF|nr:tocopherol cyclase family protein [Mycobacterium gordonae]
MEGWFWRLSDRDQGRVVVALCSANRHPEGDWSTAAIALHPGGVVRAAAVDGVTASQTRFSVHAQSGANLIDAGAERLKMVLGHTAVDLKFHDAYQWPKPFGGGGIFSSVPLLNQYWHPYRLGGKASGTVTHEDQRWEFTDATLYCERNWGAGFPLRWWWGQAHDFGDADVSVVFSGGLLELGPLNRDVTGVVVRMGDRVIRITPPALVSSSCDVRRWRIDARTARYRVELDGRGTPEGPHVLPVPLPAARRNIDTDYEYLAGTLHCRVRDWGRVIFEGTSILAGLEVGSRPC